MAIYTNLAGVKTISNTEIPSKIVIESKGSTYIRPKKGDEIKQRISINRDGKIIVARYYVTKNYEMSNLERKATSIWVAPEYVDRIFNSIKACFSKNFEPTIVYDGGEWKMTVQYYNKSVNIEGMMPSDNEEIKAITDLINDTLGTDELWVMG